MENLESDKWYSIPKGKEEEIMREGKSFALEYFIDKLEIEKSWRRERADLSFDEVLEIFSTFKMHWVFIQRNQNPYFIFGNSYEHTKEYFPYYEIGGCTIGYNPEYFLFIYMTKENGDKLVNKYNLKLI